MISLPNRKTLMALLALVLLSLSIVSCKNFFVDAKLTSIAVNPVNVIQGATASAVATGTYDDGSTKTPPDHTVWSIPVNSAATVDSKGVVTGGNAGGNSQTATLTAAVGNISGTATVTVSCGTLTSISISPSMKSIPQGTTSPFTATATYTGSTCTSGDVTGLVAWTSSDTTVFTVQSGTTNGGVVTALLKMGSGTLSATLGSVTSASPAAITVP